MLLQKIDQFITDHNLIPKKSTIVLGLSGGADSIFLLHLLARKQQDGVIKLIAAHLDHEWHDDSCKDEQFCRKLTKKMNVSFISNKISKLSVAAKFDGSQEELARKIRRQFLELVCANQQADFIALAHHLQDQQETFFIRLIRGTTLTGLTAMRPKYGQYIRPLLEVNKKDIIAYLKKHAIPYITDPSNESPKFLRNRIRKTVLPSLRSCDNRFDNNFLTTLHRLQKTEQFLADITCTTFAQISYIKQNNVYLNLKQFFATPSVMRYRLLVHWFICKQVPFEPTQAFFDEVIRFFKQPGSKEHQIHESWSLVKKKGLVQIRS